MPQKQGTSLAAVAPLWGHEEETACLALVELALAEDLGDAGDVTSALLPLDLTGAAAFVARADGIVAGLPVLRLVLAALDPTLALTYLKRDGDHVEPGTPLAQLQGRMRTMLSGERTALNFLQRLSGVATMTRRFVEVVEGLPCSILDTRKTTPGWRRLEKYAVRCGGGKNHRVGLFDGVLIKDNHLAALADQPHPINYAVKRAWATVGQKVPIEVEVDTLEQLDEALAARPDIVLLDNMDHATLREAVQRRDASAPHVQLEASGGINLATVRAVAETGVDFISVGALTHSAPALDIALDYQ